jgi:hypothetical protein
MLVGSLSCSGPLLVHRWLAEFKKRLRLTGKLTGIANAMRQSENEPQEAALWEQKEKKHTGGREALCSDTNPTSSRDNLLLISSGSNSRTQIVDFMSRNNELRPKPHGLCLQSQVLRS